MATGHNHKMGALTRTMATLLFGLSFSLPVGEASADDETVAMLVESSDSHVDVAELRLAVGRAIRKRVVSMLEGDARTAVATISIAIDSANQQASIQWTEARGGTFVTRVQKSPRQPNNLAWLVTETASFIREATRPKREQPEDRCEEVLDPWHSLPLAYLIASHEWTLASELIDPFGDSTRRFRVARYRLSSEVLDPWGASRLLEAGTRLGAPPVSTSSHRN